MELDPKESSTLELGIEPSQQHGATTNWRSSAYGYEAAQHLHSILSTHGCAQRTQLSISANMQLTFGILFNVKLRMTMVMTKIMRRTLTTIHPEM